MTLGSLYAQDKRRVNDPLDNGLCRPRCAKVDVGIECETLKMRRLFWIWTSVFAILLMAGSPVVAASAFVGTGEPQPDRPIMVEASVAVSADHLHATIAKLVSFGTRHTLSDTSSSLRGIGAARRWVQSEFDGMARSCGGCLEIVTPAETFTSVRIPVPTVVQDIVAIQRGSADPDRVILITAHVDSRVSDILNAQSDAPGANDDGSGVAAVMEAARILSHYRFAATIIYGVLSGEEQGLFGGKVLANYARARHWRVEADINNDIIGNTHGQAGQVDATEVRIFSEGTKTLETAAETKIRRYNGGELDSPSRNIARYMSDLATKYLKNFNVKLVYRTDRYGRGGDQVPFLEAGYPAVRVTEAAENYDRQHQDLRSVGGVTYGDVISGVDFNYLAQVTRLNVITLAAMASAPEPPLDVRISGAVTADTRLDWKASAGAIDYKVFWRPTTASQWQDSRDAEMATSLILRGVNIDDNFFGVSAISADGYASPIEFPGSAGAFAPDAQ